MGGRGGGGHGNGGPNSEQLIRNVYEKVQQSWGGSTINQTTGAQVPDGADKYAVTTTETISIDQNASYADFKAAYQQSQSQFGSRAPYIGVFHDDVKGTIDFNGTQVVGSKAAVDALYNAGNPVSGGAYHFASGNGYWPQGTPSQYK